MNGINTFGVSNTIEYNKALNAFWKKTSKIQLCKEACRDEALIAFWKNIYITQLCNEAWRDKYLLPNAGDELPKVVVEAPNAGEDDAPKTDVDPRGEEDWGVPNTPVEVLPKKEAPDWEPNGFVLPKGFGANGLLLVCPKPDCDPNGLEDDCPKAETNRKQSAVNILTVYDKRKMKTNNCTIDEKISENTTQIEIKKA